MDDTSLPEGVSVLTTSFITGDYIFFHEELGEYYEAIPKWYIEKKDMGTDKLEFKAWEP